MFKVSLSSLAVLFYLIYCWFSYSIKKPGFLQKPGFCAPGKIPDVRIGRNLERFFSSGGYVAQLLEQAPLDLFFHVGFNSSKYVAENSPRTVPDMAEEEQQSKASVSESEPTAS